MRNIRANIFYITVLFFFFFFIPLHLFVPPNSPTIYTGLEADLFYVHEGAINTYAMHFTVPVPADVHDLEFSWQSLTPYPVSKRAIFLADSLHIVYFSAKLCVHVSTCVCVCVCVKDACQHLTPQSLTVPPPIPLA